MSAEKALEIEDPQRNAASALFLPRSPISYIYPSGWKNIQIGSLKISAGEIIPPPYPNPHHSIYIPSRGYAGAGELNLEGRTYAVPEGAGRDYIGVFPAGLTIGGTWKEDTYFNQCLLDPKFLNRVAYESVNPDRVELMLTLPPTPDPLVGQIISTLHDVFATDPDRSCFYAESMATALAAHILKFYTTRKHTLREYTGGLSKQKLNQVLEYINEHLSENVSLAAIATELDISQYYLCRLFKQSVGMTLHAYLIQQRIEHSKHLLRHQESKIIDIAIECGFANPSHFARCFRRQLGISPQQFRAM
jgi:AraC family transcriptional regulator